MRFIPNLIYSAGFVASVWIGCEAYKDERAAHEKAETERVQYYALIAQFDKEKTESLVSLYKSDKPIEKMGCPMSEVFSIPKKGKKPKRIC